MGFDQGSTTLTLDNFGAWDTWLAYVGSFSQTLTADTWYRIKFQAIGTTLTAKTWQDGTAEPGWQVSATDASYASGTEIALHSGWTSPKHSEYDWVKVRRAVNPEPGTSVGAETVLSAGTVLGGDQSGRVYSVDAAVGIKYWGDTALTGAERVQAGLSAQVRAWSSAAFQAAYTDDVIFAVTLNTSSPTNNKVFALKASDGTLAWPTLFNLNGTDYNVDTIAGQPYVDYVNDRLYVASKAGSSGTQQSLWVIKTVDGETVLKGQPVSPCSACTVTGRHFDTSPTLSWDGATLYLGAMDGTLYAINTSDLTPKWNLPLGAGANIKTAAFVWEDYAIPGRLYFATADGNVRCVYDNGGGSACAGWTVTNVPGASTPLLLGKLFVGSSDGTVYQIDPATGLTDKRFPAAGTLDGTSKLGAISTETGNEIFVGTDGGKIFKIPLTGGALP